MSDSTSSVKYDLNNHWQYISNLTITSDTYITKSINHKYKRVWINPQLNWPIRRFLKPDIHLTNQTSPYEEAVLIWTELANSSLLPALWTHDQPNQSEKNPDE